MNYLLLPVIPEEQPAWAGKRRKGARLYSRVALDCVDQRKNFSTLFLFVLMFADEHGYSVMSQLFWLAVDPCQYFQTFVLLAA